MLDAGLDVSVDGVGNVRGRWRGTNPERGTVATGSHIDAIPLSGAYDGTVGVLGGIAAVKALRGAGWVPQRDLLVVSTTAEEPTRFGLSCIGARAMAGWLTARQLAALRDANGTTFLDAATAAGLPPTTPADAIARSRFAPAEMTHWVELHIEQATALEAAGAAVGVVTAIAAPAALALTLTGPGGHAGTVPMAGRADPLRAAADVVAAVEAAATAAGGADTVATVGALRLSPNAANSIPREVSLTVDVRDIDKRRRDAVVRAVRSAAVAAAKARRVKLSIASPNADPPAACDPDVVTAARGAAAELGMHAPDVVSRAYHDTLILAPYTRAGMVFVRCRAGVSHTPDEYASAADIEAGVKVLALTLAELARGGTPADPPLPRATSCPVTGIVASGVGSFVCPVNQLAGMVGRALGLKGVGGKGGGRAAAGGEL